MRNHTISRIGPESRVSEKIQKKLLSESESEYKTAAPAPSSTVQLRLRSKTTIGEERLCGFVMVWRRDADLQLQNHRSCIGLLISKTLQMSIVIECCWKGKSEFA